MKNIKLWFTAFSLLTVIWFSSMGCVTKKVWKNPVRGVEYKETIISFYTNFQKNEIVFIGEKYHYIFDKGTEKFSKLLQAKELLGLNDKQLTVHAYTGHIDTSKINSEIMVHFTQSQLNREQETWLQQEGYKLIQADPYFGENDHVYGENKDVPIINFYTQNYRIDGLRYIATPEVNQKVIKLKKPLALKVMTFKVEKKSTLYKISMTPLSVTADAGLIVVGVGAAILYAPFALTYIAIDKIKGN